MPFKIPSYLSTSKVKVYWTCEVKIKFRVRNFELMRTEKVMSKSDQHGIKLAKLGRDKIPKARQLRTISLVVSTRRAAVVA